MNHNRRQFGFSLIEALLATGILGVGLVLIAMVFPVGVKLTGITAERTIGSIASNEAFAKIQLWGVPDVLVWPTASLPDPDNPEHIESIDYLALLNLQNVPLPGWPINYTTNLWPEFQYPSVAISAGQEPHKYHWSALCRAVDAQQVQTTVFVTRRAGEGLLYYTQAGGQDGLWPSPVQVNVKMGGNSRELEVLTDTWGTDVFGFFGDNSTIVANHDGRIYRVLEYKAADTSPTIKNTLVLTEDWLPPLGLTSWTIWVVPPGVGSMRNPVISVVQKTLTF